MRTALLFALAVLPPSASAGVYARPPPRDYVPVFQLVGRAPETTAAGTPMLAGSPIAAIGDGALVLDGDSGTLLEIDRDGKQLAALALDAGAGLVVFDPTARRAYITERTHDQIAIVDVRPAALVFVGEIATPGEPYGIALSPDRQTLYATAIADRALVAYDVATRTERWREPVGPEPRAVAIAPDGQHAVVAHLTAGDVELVGLGARRTITRRALRHDIDPPCPKHREPKSSLLCADPEAESFARGAYAAVFLGNGVAAVAFQRESPVPRPAFATSLHYGGSAVPITRHVAFVGVAGTQAVAQVHVDEPRALAFDAAHDTLYVAGRGTDELVAIDHASHARAAVGRFVAFEEADSACGIDGLAIAADGDVLAWCAFTRSLARIRAPGIVSRGPTLTRSRLTVEQHAGFVRFHRETREIAFLARAACASCHLDGRSDGLAWQVDATRLRTPVLAGRLVGTAPYKWTGRDRDLAASLAETIKRLGGFVRVDPDGDDGRDPLVAYLEALPLPRAPSRADDAVERGEALFGSAELGCATCHAGPMLTDRQPHAFDSSPEIDTPSLRGLAAFGRYLHDGSAATLDDVLAERGSVHGMIARPLTPAERADLSAYLESRL